MKLSICMMVKDEEKNLERCLNSLEVIRNDLKSELIIVDTGSKDSTVEIAKKYTDKIYYHEWNADFSKMRNISISYATGEWIFIIDADEELIYEKELSDFIKKDSEYGSISLKIRNFTTNKRDIYAEAFSCRFFRNNRGFKYLGAVHNQPIIIEPIKYMGIYIYHYGYNSNDEELMEKKYIRTKGILLSELKKDPNNIYYRYQLSITYGMKEMWKESLEESLKVHEIIKNTKNIDLKKYANMYASFLNVCLKQKEFLKGEELGEFIFEFEKNDIDMNFYIGDIKLKLGKNEEAIKFYENYIDLLDLYEQNPELLNIDTGKMLSTIFLKDKVKNILVKIYYAKDNQKKLLDVGLKDGFEKLNINAQEMVLEIILKLERIDILKKIYTEYTEKKLLENTIEEIVEKCQVKRKILCENLGKYSELNRLYINVEEYNEVVATDKILNIKKTGKLYIKILKKAILKHGYSVLEKSIEGATDFEELKNIFEAIESLDKKIKLEIETKLEKENIETINQLQLAIYMKKIKILKNSQYDIQTFDNYLKMGELWLENVYNRQLINDESNINNILNEEDRFFIAMRLLKTAKNQVEALKLLKLALQNNMVMKKYIDYFIKQLIG